MPLLERLRAHASGSARCGPSTMCRSRSSEGEILGLIGPNGSGKSTTFNCIAGLHMPSAGRIAFEGADVDGPAAGPHLPQGHRPHVPDSAAVPQPDAPRERRAVGAFRTGRQGEPHRVLASCRRGAGARRAADRSRASRTDGLGAAALKKLELARALATQPRLLLADESLNGLDHSEMEQAADMLGRIRREKGITIVWVEHIMGVLMRVVDRVVVLDHGEVIFAGPPKEAQARTRASSRSISGPRSRRCLRLCRCRRGLWRLPGAVRHLDVGEGRRGGRGHRLERRRQDHAAARHLGPASRDRPAP